MNEISDGLVILIGLGIVFAGLIAIIILCSVSGLILRDRSKKSDGYETETSGVGTTQEIPQKQQLIAAISAVVAEELGTDVSAIRIHSIKKL